jgi:oxygen-dependent protoporphyrinogen oxidase
MLENRIFLGAIWSSTIFGNRTAEDKASFTLFVGGAQKSDLFRMDEDELISKVIAEFNSIMGIEGQPEFIRKMIWDKAIPQYNLGYIEHENYFDFFEKNNKGFFLGGNYRGGISVGDCVKNSEVISNKIIKALS